MEKYGVQEEVPKKDDKTANSNPEVCPDCNAILDNLSTTGVLKCPQCGTRPFEKRK